MAILQAITPASMARAACDDLHPLLTLRLGIAFHRAIVEVCEAFEQEKRT